MSKLPKSRLFNFPKAIAPVFDQPGATLIYHGADKFEMRFHPSVALALFARAVPVVLTLLIVLPPGILICFWVHYYFVVLLALLIFTIAAVVVHVFHHFFRRKIAPWLLDECYARGIMCNAKLLNFTVWNRLNERIHATATIPFTDVRDVVFTRGNCLALATNNGQVFPFTRALRNPDAAAALRGFIKNLTTFDTSLSPRWQESETKALHKQFPTSTPLRFSKRAKHHVARLPTQRHFTPPS